MLFYFLQSFSSLIIFRAVLGLMSLIFLPGYFLVKLLSFSPDGIEKIGFALIFGLTYQLLVIYLMFSLSTVIRIFDFQLIISIFSLIPSTLLIIFHQQKIIELSMPRRNFINSSVPIVCLLVIIGLITRFYYQDFSINPHTDTALFAEMARTLFVDSEFSSKIIHNTMPMYFQLGFNPHFFTYFSYALFFMIGGISYLTLKVATIFFGILVFIPIYALVRRLFNEPAALAAVALAAFHPIILFFSSIPINGSEIMATLFLFSSIYFLYICLTKGSDKYAFLAGIFAFATFAARADYFYVLILILPLLFLMLSKKNSKVVYLVDLAKVFICAYPLIIVTRFFNFPSIIVPISILYMLSVVWIIFMHKKKRVSGQNIVILCAVFFGLYAFHLLRWHSFPQLLEYSTADMMTNPSEKALFGFGTVDFEMFLIRLNQIWQASSIKLTQPILFLSLISLAYFRKLREVLFLLSFPVAYSIVLALLSTPITGIDHHRFNIASYLFLAILSAIILTQIFGAFIRLSESVSPKRILLKINNKRINLENTRIRTFLIITLISCFLFPFLFPLYENEIEVIKATDTKSRYNYQSAIDWLLENVGSESVIMTRKPFEFAWFTNRITKLPWPSELNINELRESIKTYKINYLVVDELFLYTYKDEKLVSLYNDPWSQPRFLPVFKTSSYPTVLIYNVTSVWSDIPIQMIGPLIEVESQHIISTKNITIEYFDPHEATGYIELSGYSDYTVRMLPNSFIFDGIEPAPFATHITNGKISVIGDPDVSYKVLFKTNLLLEIGWKDDTFLEGWESSPNEMKFETNGKLLSMSNNNTLSKTIWGIAKQKINEPVNVTQFSNLLVQYKFVNWTSDDIKQVYFTVRLYDSSGVLEETPLINPSNLGDWKVARIPVKYLKDISEIELVIRTGPETSINVEIEYIALAMSKLFYS
jgi:hypothetical protein